MALLRAVLFLALLVAMPTLSHGHSMGRSIPIAIDSELPAAALTANIVAVYFEEQMGRGISLFVKSDMWECLQAIVDKEGPMAVVPVVPKEQIPENIIVVLPGVNTGHGIFTLVMGGDVRNDLQFSLVPRYMEMLASGLSPEAWEKGIDRVKAGEGVRKVALDMLREGDLL